MPGALLGNANQANAAPGSTQGLSFFKYESSLGTPGVSAASQEPAEGATGLGTRPRRRAGFTRLRLWEEEGESLGTHRGPNHSPGPGRPFVSGVGLSHGLTGGDRQPPARSSPKSAVGSSSGPRRSPAERFAWQRISCVIEQIVRCPTCPEEQSCDLEYFKRKPAGEQERRKKPEK